MTDTKHYGFQTRAIHLGQEPDAATGAVTVPIYQTTAFVQSEERLPPNYAYSRFANPTRSALETALAGLEGGTQAFALASGMAAISVTVLALLQAGDHVVVGDDVYGGTYQFFAAIVSRYGIAVAFANTADPAAVAAALTPRTKMLFIETPTNPLLSIADLAALATLAQARGVITVVDNTFASPYLQRPFESGIDIVVHSTTKYIAGHSDVTGGAIILRDDRFTAAINMHKNAFGPAPDSFAAWLTLRGLKTLALRMRAHCENAQILAEFLEAHPAVDRVIYPGLPSYPQYDLARRQMKGPGGMIAFYLAPERNPKLFMKNLALFRAAVSLGGVESLVTRPVDITHASVPWERREAKGITGHFIRLSVGIEDVDDLRNDLDAGLAVT